MSELQVYLNGTLTPASAAKVSVFDTGFLHGASTFTTMLAKNGRVFRFEQHLERLSQAVQTLGLNVAASSGELVEAMYQVLTANNLTDARCRITLTPGGEGAEPTTLVTAQPLPDYPTQWYTQGVLVTISPLKQWAGDPIYGLKTGCYLPRMLSMQQAAAQGAQDALWFNIDNNLAESCFSNVFLVQEGQLRTPPIGTPVLPGVVRQAVLDVAEPLDIPVDIETPLTIHDLLASEEVFLTSSTMGIRPVCEIEKHSIGEETPGPMTKKIMAAYADLLEKECQPEE